MGQWHIAIQGEGAHHNKFASGDANQLMAEFVKQLKSHGHTIEHATFTHGGRDDLSAVVATPAPKAETKLPEYHQVKAAHKAAKETK